MSHADWLAEVGAALVWPDQMEAWAVYRSMNTQWNMGPRGPVGLRYETLPEIWRRVKVPPERRDEVFLDLQILEAASLNAMYEE